MDLTHPPTSRPIRLAGPGTEVAVEVAVGLLRAAGCGRDSRPGAGLRVRYGGHAVDCAVGWAGPVTIPLAGEADVQAACGIMAVHGRRTGAPVPLCVPYASTAAGVLAAQGVLAALIDQRRGGRTHRVATSVAQAALLTVGQYLATATATATAPDTGTRQPAAGRGWPGNTGGEPPPFAAADGARFEIETFEAGDWQRFWTGLGAEEGAIRRGWRPFQHRYATATCPLPAELARAAGRHGLAAVAAVGAATGVNVVRLRDTPPAPPDPPWRVTSLAGEQAGTAPAPGSGGPPSRGDAPLDGFVVVEATSRLQGPLAGHLLRLLGADVIRIEPPGGDPMRGVPPVVAGTSARFRALNDGKRVVEVDLKSAAGSRIVRELVAGADVFLHNWAPSRATDYRLEVADLLAVRADLVYAHASGWGDALGAQPPKGTDYLVQAYSGLAARVWPDHRLAPSLLTLTDVLGGLVCAAGVLAGLLDRLCTGGPRRVDSSLLSAAGLLLHRSPGLGHAPVHRATSQSSTQRRLVAAPTDLAYPPRVPACADLAELAADPRFAGALNRRGCAFVRSPWEFGA